MSVARNCDFRLGSHLTPTTLVDLTGKTTSVDHSFDTDMFETTTFGNASGGIKPMETGLSEAKMSLEFLWDSTIDSQLRTIIRNGTEVDYQFGPNGSSVGNMKITGKCVLGSLSTPFKVGEQIRGSVEINNNTYNVAVY